VSTNGLPIEERAARTRSRLKNVGDIPTLPPVLIQVWELTTQQNTSASDLGKAIGGDPGLTGAVLRLANSAYFGFPRKVATVTQAVVILGFDTVKSLAMGASVFRALGAHGGPIDPEAFFRHSLVTALGARLVMERRSPGKAGTAFCGGILHDLGRLVIAEFLPKSLREIETRVAKGETPEDAELDTRHTYAVRFEEGGVTFVEAIETHVVVKEKTRVVGEDVLHAATL
jgi:HD-like signal output (HDOD) protein